MKRNQSVSFGQATAKDRQDSRHLGYSLVVLRSMTRRELRLVAKRLGLRTGRNKQDTIWNISQAFLNRQARLTVDFTIRPRGDAQFRITPPAIFRKKLRTHKPDKVIFPVTIQDNLKSLGDALTAVKNGFRS